MYYNETMRLVSLHKTNKMTRKDLENKIFSAYGSNRNYSESVQEEPKERMYSEDEVLEEKETWMETAEVAFKRARKDWEKEKSHAINEAKEEFIEMGEKILKRARKDWEKGRR